MPDDLAIRRLADRYEPRFRQAIYAIIATLSQSPDLNLLEAAIDRGDLAQVMRLWETEIVNNTTISIDIISELLEESVRRAGTITINTIPNAVIRPGTYAIVETSLQRMSELALAWITRQSNYLVTGITADARTSLRTLLETGYRQGLGARWTARQMRSVVGLLPQHTAAVGRYITTLQEQRFPANVIARNAETYARRLLTYRTENIARTETITASSAGQLAGWQANIASGLLQAHRTWVEWMVTEDDRLCPLCAPMDGQRVRVGEMFVSEFKGFPEGQPTAQGPGSRRLARRGPLKPDPFAQPRDPKGRFMRIKKANTLVPLPNANHVPYPPLHPSCRCAMVLRFDP